MAYKLRFAHFCAKFRRKVLHCMARRMRGGENVRGKEKEEVQTGGKRKITHRQWKREE